MIYTVVLFVISETHSIQTIEARPNQASKEQSIQEHQSHSTQIPSGAGLLHRSAVDDALCEDSQPYTEHDYALLPDVEAGECSSGGEHDGASDYDPAGRDHDGASDYDPGRDHDGASDYDPAGRDHDGASDYDPGREHDGASDYDPAGREHDGASDYDPGELVSVNDDAAMVAEGTTDPVGRFAMLDDQQVDSFIDQQRNRNTLRKTKCHVELFTSYLVSRGELRDPSEIPAPELDDFMAAFFISVRQVGGKEYEPATLRSIQSSLERYLKGKRYGKSIITGTEFVRSKEALVSKCRFLRKIGKGRKPNQKRAPTQEEIQTIWESGAIGGDDPESLQLAMWWIINSRFRKRSNQENQALRWGNLSLCTSDSGVKYLAMNEEDNAADPGSNPVYEDTNNPKCCPVALYELYSSKRPSSMCQSASRFYISPKIFTGNMFKHATTWYKIQPHGINSIKKYMRLIAKRAGVPLEVSLNRGEKKRSGFFAAAVRSSTFNFPKTTIFPRHPQDSTATKVLYANCVLMVL